MKEHFSAEELDVIKPLPQPTWSRPMLATLTRKQFSDPGWIFERKLDGERAMAFRQNGEVRITTRNNKDISDTYPEIVEALEGAGDEDFIVDGEIVALEGDVTSFSRLQQRMKIKDRGEAEASPIAVYYYIFDIIHLDGMALNGLPLRRRKSLLKETLAFEDPLRYSEHRNTEGEALFREACEQGWEGIIAKRADSPYQAKRSRDWLKFKCANGQELVIGGFTEPKGSRTGFGALLVGYYDHGNLRYAGKVGTGYDEQQLKELRRQLDTMSRGTSPFSEDVDSRDLTWVNPKLVGEFGFTEWTTDGKLRHPRFIGLRRDKEAHAVTREQPTA